MSYNGTGIFTINTPGQPVVTGTTITSTAFNALTTDLATGLTNALTKDGQSTPTANIKMGSYKLTGLGVATTAGDALSFGNNATIATLILTTALGVAYGGLGVNTLPANAVIIGNGTSGVTSVAPGTTGNILTSNGTTWTSAAAPASGVTSVSGGTTGLTPSTPTSGAIVLAGTLAATNGGTGATTASGARTNLSAAVSGANGDITSLTGLTTPLSAGQGGTGVITSTGSGSNVLSASPTLTGTLTTAALTATGTVTLTTALTVANGGTGQTTISAARTAIGTGVAVTKTANYTAVAGDVLACDTIAVGAFSITLPATPTAGDKPIVIFDAGTTDAVNGFATNNLTVLRNGSTVHTLSQDVTFSTKGVCVTFEYVAGTWRLEIGR